MADDTTFCGVFDGHGPCGHLVARKVRDVLPLKLQSFLHGFQAKQNESGTTCFNGNMKKPDVVEFEKDGTTEDKMLSLWREAFLKSYKAMDKELKSHSNLDCFCSGSTAVTMVKQVCVCDINFAHIVCLYLGCTCSYTFSTLLSQLKGSNLFMGYIGDSRAVLGSKDDADSLVAIQLSVDMKPDLPSKSKFPITYQTSSLIMFSVSLLESQI